MYLEILDYNIELYARVCAISTMCTTYFFISFEGVIVPREIDADFLEVIKLLSIFFSAYPLKWACFGWQAEEVIFCFRAYVCVCVCLNSLLDSGRLSFITKHFDFELR